LSIPSNFFKSKYTVYYSN